MFFLNFDVENVRICCRQGKFHQDCRFFSDQGRVERALSRCQLINVFGVGTDASSSNVTDLSCQCIKLVGKRQLDAAFQHELTFADHVHQFDAGLDIFGGSK